MTRNRFLAALLGTALGLAAAGPAAAKDDDLKRLILVGQDGDKSYFAVTCKDGFKSSVSEGAEGVCTISRKGEKRCNKTWTLMQAGHYACKAPR